VLMAKAQGEGSSSEGAAEALLCRSCRSLLAPCGQTAQRRPAGSGL